LRSSLASAVALSIGARDRYSADMTGIIYKIVPAPMWQEAVDRGRFDGAPVDLADGFIHFSTSTQVRETAAKHFAGQDDLLLVAVDGDALGAGLRYEVSRGGALFPHLYGALDPAIALWAKPLPLASDGRHVFPQLQP
jgi:uncharacterized protein (DUF952 family)